MSEQHVHNTEWRHAVPKLTNKAVLVIGGSRGIGAAIVKRPLSRTGIGDVSTVSA
jgi:hypothetical protein